MLFFLKFYFKKMNEILYLGGTVQLPHIYKFMADLVVVVVVIL